VGKLAPKERPAKGAAGSNEIGALIGSTIQELRILLPSGTTELLSYSAFGEKEHHGENLSPWGYFSKREVAPNLILFGRRFYHTQLLSWLTPDPRGLAEGPSLYSFLRGNPLRHLDLYGLGIFSQDQVLFQISLTELWNIMKFSLHMLGSALFLTNEHLNPSSLLQEGVAAVANALRTPLPPMELDEPNIQEVGDPDTATSVLIYQNGMMNRYQEARDTAAQIAAKSNALVILCHTHTGGFLSDLIMCTLSKLGFRTSASDMVQRSIEIAKEFKAKKKLSTPIITIDHSRGNLYTDVALRDLDTATLDNLVCIGIGSPILAHTRKVKKEKFFISDKDWIPMICAPIDRWRAARGKMNDTVTILQSDTHPWKCDHAIQGDTYQKVLLDVCDDIFGGKYN